MPGFFLARVLDSSISPNAPRTKVVGLHDGALRIRLSAPPMDGSANDALRNWLGGQLGLPQSQVQLLRGQASRRKQWAMATEEAIVIRWLSTFARIAKLRPTSRNPRPEPLNQALPLSGWHLQNSITVDV
jgi:uncharacterized protein (TIGR00251 family)